LLSNKVTRSVEEILEDDHVLQEIDDEIKKITEEGQNEESQSKNFKKV